MNQLSNRELELNLFAAELEQTLAVGVAVFARDCSYLPSTQAAAAALLGPPPP